MAAVVAASAIGAPAAHGQDATGPVYEVQSGDTMASIAQAFGLSLDELSAANPGLDPAALPIGRLLVIPGMNGVTGKLTTHPLEAGETLDSLSARLGFQRETTETGWSASMLLLLVDDVVVYKLWSGTPRVEERGKETNPLGPAQDLSDPARNAIPKP